MTEGRLSHGNDLSDIAGGTSGDHSNSVSSCTDPPPAGSLRPALSRSPLVHIFMAQLVGHSRGWTDLQGLHPSAMLY